METGSGKEVPHVILMSFGFKYGQPQANYFFDVGFIKNPARQDGWSFFAEIDQTMRNYVLGQPTVQTFINCTCPLLVLLAQIDQQQVFAFGCNAGRHRSPIVVDAMAGCLEREGISCHIEHRELDRC